MYLFVELEAKPAELGGERVVDEENVHVIIPSRARPAARIALRSGASRRPAQYRARTSSAAASPSG